MNYKFVFDKEIHIPILTTFDSLNLPRFAYSVINLVILFATVGVVIFIKFPYFMQVFGW